MNVRYLLACRRQRRLNTLNSSPPLSWGQLVGVQDSASPSERLAPRIANELIRLESGSLEERGQRPNPIDDVGRREIDQRLERSECGNRVWQSRVHPTQ